MVQHKAHNVADRPRTEDIQIDNDIDFKSMLLPQPILKGLNKSGYKKPSPIQKKALPLVRCGMDLIIQAKAGTGKTCVFSVAALEMVRPDLPHLQAVVLAPTREIALQITEVISIMGQNIADLKISCFIGGYPVSLDKEKAHKCHIAVGTPGRMRHLIQTSGHLTPKHTRLFVLDEADKLMEPVFVKDINAIYSSLPESKQVLACSATYTPQLVDFLSRYMHRGQYVTPQSSSDSILLLGLRQFVSVLPHHVDKLATLRLKERQLLDLLSSVSFDQCLIFSNLHLRAESVCETLRKKGWAVEWIAGRQTQEDRVTALAQLKEQRVRVLVTTDLTARGIDIENVNMVINLDLPQSHETYLHRMGRAGRYGSHGMVITIISKGRELEAFEKLLGRIGGTSLAVNVVPGKLKNVDLWTIPDSELEKVQGAVEVIPSEKSDSESTDTDEKLSKESSDDELSEKPAEGTCTCGLLEISPDSIEEVSVSSLFSVQEMEPDWQDVSPVVVYESKIPLNTEVTLVGSKVIRVKSLNENLDASEPCDLVDKSVPFNERFCIEFDGNGSKSPSKILSFKEIKQIMETGFPKCEVEKHEEKNIFTNLKELKQKLREFQASKETVEHTLKVFDNFDVVGWMSVDGKENIVKSLKLDYSNVYRFDLVKCSAGKNHIEVLNSFDNKTETEKRSCQGTISILNLDKFKLSPPYSLKDIAKCFTRSDEKRCTKSKETIKRTKIKNKKESPITLESELKGNKQAGLRCHQKSSNDKTTKKSKTNHFGTRQKSCVNKKAMRNIQHKLPEPSSQNYGKKEEKKSVKHKNNGQIVIPKSDLSSSESSEYISQSSSSESDTCLPMSNQTPLVTDLLTNGQNHLSSNEESESYIETSSNPLKSRENLCVKKCESDKSSDIISNLNQNSDSDNSSCSGSETFQSSGSKRIDDSLSSSNCSYEIANDRKRTDCCVKLVRNCKNKDKMHHSTKHYTVHNVTSESFDSVESKSSNNHSCQTTRVENRSFDRKPQDLAGKSCKKEYFYSQPSCSSKPKPTRSASRPRQTVTNLRMTNSEFTRNNFHESSSQTNEYNHNTRRDFYQPHRQTSQEKLFNNPKPSNPKILTSKNLFRDWYSTWYMEVRRKAQQIEYTEYINTMCSRR